MRGGIPICFPWFGSLDGHPDAPLHGFARTSQWHLVDVLETPAAVVVRLRLTDDAESRSSEWPHRFEAIYTVAIGEQLSVTLDVTNRDTSAIRLEEAFHTYYAVADSRDVTVRGLEGQPFLEKGSAAIEIEDHPVSIGDGISRKYQSAASATIVDGGNGRVIHATAAGASSSVLWNPGETIASSMPDFDTDEWMRTLCFEPCNIGQGAIVIHPGEVHRQSLTISVEKKLSGVSR
jgi:D-hexose-6-phosphate mutarotase